MNDEWDGVDIHFQHGGGDQQAMNTACNIILSTWDGPNRRVGNRTEDRVGYTFENIELVTCPKCKEWMTKNLNHCTKCGDLCCYSVCKNCLEFCVCGALWFEVWKD
jgi:hypothetical protein